MPLTELETNLLKHVRPNYRPVKPRVILKQLELPEDQFRDVKMAIKRLVKKGQLSFGPNHLVGLPGDGGDNAVTGVFRRNAAGFGFVRPAGSRPGDDRRKDIFIPANRSADAATGDTVLVRLSKKKTTNRLNSEGEIVRVLERETHQFVGLYYEEEGIGFVQVDGTLFAQPVSVGDPGAKNSRPGDKVVFEMVRFPSHIHPGEGVIAEVLGPRGSPGVDTLSVIREFDLPEGFPEDALTEARKQAEAFNESVRGRVDLTNETIITIDPVDARDFDDAISLSRDDEGEWRLGVHIADVSHFVPVQSALDREARERGNSTYLPDRVLPMLPEIISNSLASLQPDRVRYTMSAFIHFTGEGVPVKSEFAISAIRSSRRFTYEEVDDYLARPKTWLKKLTPEVHALLGRMHTLAMILRKRRYKRGALELSLSEVKLDLDKEGRVVGAHKVENTESHQVIEEFMLAANEAVAEHLAAAEVIFLRRVHASPDPRKLQTLTSFVRELGYNVENLESRFELQEVLARVVGKPEEHAVNYALLRSLQQAVYSPVEEGHYALASKCYCHFTSPIRRYPDLTIHRQLRALLLHRKPKSDPRELVVQGEHCSDRERRSEAAERELTKVKLLTYLSTRIGEAMDAVITGVEEFGLFAQGLELPAEGLIHVTALADDYYHFERASHTLTGRRGGNRFRLGDVIRVEVARVDVDRRELDFRLVTTKKRADHSGKRSETASAPRRSGRPKATGTHPRKGGRRR